MRRRRDPNLGVTDGRSQRKLRLIRLSGIVDAIGNDLRITLTVALRQIWFERDVDPDLLVFLERPLWRILERQIMFLVVNDRELRGIRSFDLDLVDENTIAVGSARRIHEVHTLQKRISTLQGVVLGESIPVKSRLQTISRKH